MQIETMRRILQIADEGSISEAARKQFITQPTLSHLLKVTENELGAPLFIRNGRELKLTYAGEEFVHMARKMMASYDDLRKNIREIGEGTRDRIRLGMTARRGISYLPVILPQLLQKYPHTEIEQLQPENETEQKEMLLYGEADIVLSYYPSVDPHLEARPIKGEQFMLLASAESSFGKAYREYAFEDGKKNPKRVSLRIAEQERFILVARRYKTREAFGLMAHEAGMQPELMMEVNTLDIALGLVKAGMGVAILPQVLTCSEKLCGRDGSLLYFMLDSIYTERPAYLCLDRTRYRSAVQEEFIRLTEEHFGIRP